MNEIQKVISVESQAASHEQGTEGPARTYRRPQVHDLGSLEQVQSGSYGDYRDGPSGRGYRYFR